MENLIRDFLKYKRFAVVGSFSNESKFAYQIFRYLTGRGYDVFPVNPKLPEVDGKVCYKTVSEIPSDIDVVNIVTPPAVTENILKECLGKGIKRAWLQPGAESAVAIKFCDDHGIAVIYGACVMLKSLEKG